MAYEEYEYSKWRIRGTPVQALDEEDAREHFSLTQDEIERGISSGKLTVLAFDKDGLRLLEMRGLREWAKWVRWIGSISG